jgi:hypothetical protein
MKVFWSARIWGLSANSDGWVGRSETQCGAAGLEAQGAVDSARTSPQKPFFSAPVR